MSDGSLGYTTGVFDLFHVGHLNLLRKASLECCELIVGVTTDELVETKKGKVPVIPLQERMQIVEAIRFVDHVVIQDNYDKVAAWSKLQFNVLFVGSDWRGTELWNEYEQRFGERNVEVRYLPYTQHTSSSMLRRVLEQL